MFRQIEESPTDFFPKFLNLIAKAFAAGDVAIIHCKDKKSGEISQVMALVQLNDINRKIEFYPIARMYAANPMNGIELIHGGAVLASQIPMEKWIEKAEEQPIDLQAMN